MIRYALVCEKKHEFESWFPDSAAFDRQNKRGLVACPACGSVKIDKALMTPRLAGSRKRAVVAEARSPADATPVTVPAAEAPAPVAMMSPQERELRTKLRELRDHLVANAEHVGRQFPDEARKMHYGEIEHRSIYGEASAQEAKDLAEEGIEFHPLPILPDDRN
jgi:hypothetical protein